MKFEEIKEKALDFFEKHETGIGIAVDLFYGAAVGGLCAAIGWRKGFYDGANATGRVLFDVDPDAYVKVTKHLQEAAKKK